MKKSTKATKPTKKKKIVVAVAAKIPKTPTKKAVKAVAAKATKTAKPIKEPKRLKVSDRPKSGPGSRGPMSKETRAKMSAAHKGKKFSPETRAAISAGLLAAHARKRKAAGLPPKKKVAVAPKPTKYKTVTKKKAKG